VTAFFEVLGLKPQRASAAMAAARAFLDRPAAHGGRRSGISPHAPYSTSLDLTSQAVRLAVEQELPVAMHLAETKAELEFLATGGGAFTSLMAELDAWQEGPAPTGTCVLDYLRILAEAPKALVIHGNYLADQDVEFLARHADRMAVVYCPRTHTYFGHARYPLAERLAAGVRMALGTDGRASNPDLNLLAEMRHAAGAHPDVDPAAVLCMGTIEAARALGRNDETGTLEPGKLGDLCLVQLPERTPRDPYDLLFDPGSGVCATCCRGWWWARDQSSRWRLLPNGANQITTRPST
jgi:cytosine/adenosine deaminase-related metal-dependent hydrolase